MTHDVRGDGPRDRFRDDEPLELRALLDDRRSPERWAAFAARIEAAAAPELARRSARAAALHAVRAGRLGLLDGVAAAVARFAGPALVAAAAAVILAIAASRPNDPADGAPDAIVASSEALSDASLSEATVRQALGAEPNAWLSAGAGSDADALVRAMYGGGGQE